MNIEDYGWSMSRYWEPYQPIYFLDDIPNGAIGYTNLSLFWHGNLVFRNQRGYVNIFLRDPYFKIIKKYTGQNFYQGTRDVFVRLLKAENLPNGLKYKSIKKEEKSET